MQRNAYFGPRTELSCTRRSLPRESIMLIWSPVQTRITVPSKFFAPDAPDGAGAPFGLSLDAPDEAYKPEFFSFALLSAPRRRSMAPAVDANIPACQSTTRAKPAATRCSATFPAGCKTAIGISHSSCCQAELYRTGANEYARCRRRIGSVGLERRRSG